MNVFCPIPPEDPPETDDTPLGATIIDDPLALMVDESTGAVLINNAQVIAADIMASDGVIHAIDQVILTSDLAQ